MATWGEIEQDAPDFAARVRARFEIGTNKTIATLRRDRSPRISASELEFAGDQVPLGMMGDSRKLHDVRRDPRIAVHSPTLERMVPWKMWHSLRHILGPHRSEGTHVLQVAPRGPAQRAHRRAPDRLVG